MLVKCTLLHGFAGDPAVWDAVIEAWPLGQPPVAAALPGHGGPPVAAGWDANLEALAARGLGDVVIGYSLGARLALGLVARGLAARAVLIGVNPGIDDAERPARRASDAAWAALLRSRGIAAFADAWAAQPLFASQARAPLARRLDRRARRLRHDPEQLARSLEELGLAAMPDYRPALAGLAGRVALVAGAEDERYVAAARAAAAASPGLWLALVPDSGHDPTLEQPAALAAALGRALGWLAGGAT